MSNDGARSRGLLVVVSAPSGTGKTTLVEVLVERCEGLERSRSYTSRAPRAGEQDGVDYNFVSRQTFESMIDQDAFLEWADVFGHLYGTGRADTESARDRGLDVVLVIDVQGAEQVRQRAEAVSVFVLPPSLAVLESRLRRRSQDAEEAIRHRLDTARAEVLAVDDYDYVVVNDDFDRCVGELVAIVRAERARRIRRAGVIGPIVKTFLAPPE
ncbi:MAG TPA: guanylate kinase [Vicinamibacterales bacterium]|nr:guanylate kinase [Vicinamibacterales bacterium]